MDIFYYAKEPANQDPVSFHSLITHVYQEHGIYTVDPKSQLIITLMMCGYAEYHTATEHFLIHPQEIIITPPNEEHHLFLSPDPYHATVAFNKQDIEKTGSALSRSPKELLDQGIDFFSSPPTFPSQCIQNDPALIQMLSQIDATKEILPSHPDVILLQDILYHKVLLTLMEQLLCNQLSHISEKNRPNKTLSEEMEKRIQRTVFYIIDRYNQSISLQELASIANMSESHFTRVFQQQMGITPYRYLMKTRIQRAQVLLKHTRKSITDIAFEVGFQSLSAFNHCFSSQTGSSPRTYRNQT